MGLKIWGSPVTPLSGGAFGVDSPEERAALYNTIPTDIDVVITHGPPYGILDCPPGSGTHIGCPQLLDAVMRLRPRIHLFGHAHAAFGMVQKDDTLYVNAAMLRLDGSIRTAPITLRMPRL
jgi:Icc-related predicted phosphoesterase